MSSQRSINFSVVAKLKRGVCRQVDDGPLLDQMQHLLLVTELDVITSRSATPATRRSKKFARAMLHDPKHYLMATANVKLSISKVFRALHNVLISACI